MEAEQLDEDIQKESPRTLGDVLYAKKRAAPAPETEWVGLVQAVAAGDQAALHSLYARAHRLVFTLAMRITLSRETAEEVTLDVFHDVWRRASSYEASHGTVLAWIMNQARSRAIDRLRFEKRKKRTDPGADATQPLAADPAEIVDTGRQAAALREALAVLTPDERRAIESAFLSELSHAEVAARLNVPLGTVKTRIRSGLQKLRDVMREPRRPG